MTKCKQTEELYRLAMTYATPNDTYQEIVKNMHDTITKNKKKNLYMLLWYITTIIDIIIGMRIINHANVMVVLPVLELNLVLTLIAISYLEASKGKIDVQVLPYINMITKDNAKIIECDMKVVCVEGKAYVIENGKIVSDDIAIDTTDTNFNDYHPQAKAIEYLEFLNDGSIALRRGYEVLCDAEKAE